MSVEELEKLYADLSKSYGDLKIKIDALKHGQAEAHREISAAIDQAKIEAILKRVK